MNTSHNFSSYPPFFRPNQSADNGQQSNSDPKLDSLTYAEPGSLPLIDFETLNPAHLSQVCREWGMFRLTNHGVSVELLAQLHDHANKLFSESFESKEAIPTTPMLYFWGNPALTMSGNSQQKGPRADRHNWLEGLNVPLAKISHFHYQDPLLESFRLARRHLFSFLFILSRFNHGWVFFRFHVFWLICSHGTRKATCVVTIPLVGMKYEIW